MITKFFRNLFAISIITVAISSCSFGGHSIGMLSDEGIDKIKEVIKENLNLEEYKIYRLTWKEDDGKRKLDNVLSTINVLYLDKEDNRYDQKFVLKDGKYIPEEAIKRDANDYYSFKLTTPIDIEGLNGEEIRKFVTEGAELVMNEDNQYEIKSVEEVELSINPPAKSYEKKWDGWSEKEKAKYKEVEQTFQLNFIKKDEHDKVVGKHLVSNYYTIPFIVNQEGKAEIKQ